MPLSDEQKHAVLAMLEAGKHRDHIARELGVRPAQVSAIAAHRTMGKYAGIAARADPVASAHTERATERPDATSAGESTSPMGEAHILIGLQTDSGRPVFWNPYPASGTSNPHVLIVGESGSGKTYALLCLIAELAKRGIPSVVIDYGQGFSLNHLPTNFSQAINVTELKAGVTGIALNPFEIFPFDNHGPVNVGQRIADTFARIYNIGVQQHTALRSAVIDTLATGGIIARDPKTWSRPAPPFSRLLTTLQESAADSSNPARRFAASVAAHISSVFVFDTFRQTGRPVSWRDLMRPGGGLHVVQLKGLEQSLERVVTELLLWNLVGYIESLGPGDLRCFCFLDEAHRLSFDVGSAAERLLREGRKFGVGLVLASQQAADFSETAISNTATKLVFQISDRHGGFARLLTNKSGVITFRELNPIVHQLPRGTCFYLHQNAGCVVTITSLDERVKTPVTAIT